MNLAMSVADALTEPAGAAPMMISKGFASNRPPAQA
jgi:hypothetical protein